MESKSEPAFYFVNFSGSSVYHGQDDSTRRRIRQQAMREVGKQRRKPARNHIFDLAPELPDEATRLSSQPSRLGTVHLQHSPALAKPFGDQHPFAIMYNSWGMDPFAVYAFGFALKGQNSPSSHGSFWFPFAFEAPEFYRRMLTGPEIRAALNSQPKKKSTAITLTRFSSALDCIKDRLVDPDINVAAANNVMRAVLGIICYNFTAQDYAQAAMHFKGLQRMIAARGGFESLSNDHDLQLMIFWLDVTSALVYKKKPVFPIPSDLIRPLSLPSKYLQALGDMLFGAKTSYLKLDTKNSSIIRSLGDLAAFSAVIESELVIRGDKLWEDDIFLGLGVNPIAHCLFNTPPAALVDIECDHILETTRLGAIIFIIWIKQRSLTYPGSRTKSYWSALLSLMKHTTPDGPILTAPDLTSLNLWVLVLCALTASDPSHQSAAMEFIVKIAFVHTLTSWEAVMERVRLMPWVSALELPCSQLRVKFEKGIGNFH